MNPFRQAVSRYITLLPGCFPLYYKYKWGTLGMEVGDGLCFYQSAQSTPTSMSATRSNM